jgi:hypothetical protein
MGNKAPPEWVAANKKLSGEKAVSVHKIAKLKRLTTARGATPAEAENARDKAATLTAKAARLRNPYDPPPLPAMEELARRKGKRRPPDADQIVRLKAEVARLTEENARLKLARSKAGRKPIGDRAMTPAERMARMRLHIKN